MHLKGGKYLVISQNGRAEVVVRVHGPGFVEALFLGINVLRFLPYMASPHREEVKMHLLLWGVRGMGLLNAFAILLSTHYRQGRFHDDVGVDTQQVVDKGLLLAGRDDN